MRNIFTKTVAVMAMSVMTLTAWAIDIPQDLGTYIAIGTVYAEGSETAKSTADGITLTNCKVDGNQKAEIYTSYTIGSTGEDSRATFSLSNSTEQDYLFTFFSGSRDQAGRVSFTLSDGGTYNVKKEFDISDTDDWKLTERHIAVFEDVPATSLTLTFEVESTGSGYYGNYGNISFTGANQIPLPDSESNLLDVTRATTSGMKIDGTFLTEITANSYADDIYMYVSEDGYYQVYAGYGYATAGTDNFTITITDIELGTAEVNAKNYTVTDSKKYLMTDRISAGWKKIRLDHPGPTITPSFRLEKMYFIAIQDLPITGSSVLDFSRSSMTSSSSPRYESATPSEVSYIKNGGYTDELYVNNLVTATYDLNTVKSNYNQGGTFKVTITDVATGTVEVNAQESEAITSSTQSITMRLNNPITQGLKKLRFDYVNTSAGNNYLFNIKDVSFSFVNYTRPFAHMNLNTLCFPYQIDSYTGATFYTIQETEVSGGELTKLVLEEHVGVLEAGVPYFYDPDPEASELVCTFNGDYTDIQPGAGGLTGSYADDSPVPANKYVTVNNMLYKTGDNVTMAEYRAYVDPVAYSRPAMAGRKRRTIGRYDAPTAVESIQKSEVSVQKVIRNGQFLIIRDGVEYNATGQILK